MTTVDLTNVGNFPGYVHERRFAKSIGHIEVASPAVVLKFYHMTAEGNPANFRETEEKAKRFVRDEVTNGRIERLSGLGFAILSDEMLNVAVWGAKNFPYVPLNHLYQFDTGFTEIREVDIREYGAFSAWEKGIDAHEAGAWMRFLASPREYDDKVVYVHDIITGELWPAKTAGRDAGD